MRVPVEVQVWRLTVLFVVGAVSDLLFQSYRAFRAVFRPKRLGHHLLDALAAILLLAGLGATVLIINWGELRMYVPVSIFLGALMTHALVGGATYRSAFRAFVSLRKGLNWGHRRIVTPTVRTAQRTARWVKHALFPPSPPQPPVPPDDGDPPPRPGT
ncbi:MAG: spore cortex biosynthesis protein YabQ [Bacillota bacterium]